ncbi:hypothetical protein IEQ34_016640 [Dendrobium chrysotoxum]|uniref:non-specific serine/threonine protein kinase n=1 Tax=Dendrobium chrysotoxum TaxID=161865 RepID=A0AAV7GF46_DENCH|nr:hypothetical protein IEQ34_016640 [Dendrobium chrysotoxum]
MCMFEVRQINVLSQHVKTVPSEKKQNRNFLELSDPSVPGNIEDSTDISIYANVIAFSLFELETITKSFRSDYVLGEGGFGTVYKGYIDENVRVGLKSLPVAVKVLNKDGHQGHREWLTEVNFLGQLRHPNLVKLIGYCCEDDHRLLVYEFMFRGSLENHLFRRYHRFENVEALNEKDYTTKLSDFGLAKAGPEGDETHVSTRVMGTYGYAAPEYVMTGHLTAKSDVYSFGVVLLELLTGRRSVDKTRPGKEQSLVDWARPKLNDKKKLLQVIDPRLEELYSIKAAQKACSLAYYCLSLNPKARPLMRDVVETLEPLQGNGGEQDDGSVPVLVNQQMHRRLVSNDIDCRSSPDPQCSSGGVTACRVR